MFDFKSIIALESPAFTKDVSPPDFLLIITPSRNGLFSSLRTWWGQSNGFNNPIIKKKVNLQFL